MKEETYFLCSQRVQPGRSSSGLKEDDRTHPGWNSASQYLSIEIKGLILIGDLGWDHCSGHVKIHVNQENRAWVDFSLSCTFSTPKTSLEYTSSIAIAMVKCFFQPSSEKIHQALRWIILNIIKFSENYLSPRPNAFISVWDSHTKEAQISEQKQKLWVPQFIKVKTLAKDNSQVNWQLVSEKR